MRRNFDPRFRFPSALGGNFVQLPSFWTISVVRCPEYRGCPYVGGQKYTIYIYIYGKSNRCHDMSPLYGGCPLLGESVMGGFTVYL